MHAFADQYGVLYEGGQLMEEIGQYLLRLTAAALVCGIATAFLGAKGAFGGVIKLLAGIYLTLHIVSPWVQLRLDVWADLSGNFTTAAGQFSAQGQNTAREAMAERITQQTQAYILDKARSLDAELTVDVFLGDGAIPVPIGVRLEGNISPYARKLLSQMLKDDLGIPAEEQIWI